MSGIEIYKVVKSLVRISKIKNIIYTKKDQSV